MQFQRIVITKIDLKSKILGATIPKGTICIYDERMKAIAFDIKGDVKSNRSEVYIGVKDNGKYFKDLEWVDVKK